MNNTDVIMKRNLSMIFGLIAVFSTACGEKNGTNAIAVQHWKDADVRIETHPNPPLAGMSEIVVIVTGSRGRPIQDLTVSMRASESMPWVQAIQDGLIGVYRRAVDIGDGESIILQVRLQQGSDEQVMRFPIKLAAS
jgi:hypothetical protein